METTPHIDANIIFLGGGLKECLLAALFSIEGKKVLLLDEGSNESLELESIPEGFRSEQFTLDRVPKLLLVGGQFTKLISHSKINKSIEFVSCRGNFVRMKNGKIHNVPGSEDDALSCSYLGLFEKKRLAKLLHYVSEQSEESMKTMRTEDLFDKFKISEQTREVVMRCLALHTSDESYKHSAIETV